MAVGLPTIVRHALHGTVVGCEFTPYLPFVLFSAILLGWWQAGLVALAAVAILGGMFAAPTNGHVDMPCFLSGAGIFLASSAMTIGVVILVRRMLAASLGRDPDESASGIIFSVERGEVWATWRGSGPPLRLGPKRHVGKVMEEFLSESSPSSG